jgi:trimethylamine--corrinoid protein Co-methyltransferase
MTESSLDVATRQPLCPLGSDFRVTFYDEHVLGRYERAILQVLERTGVRFGSPKALDILEVHGAAVDHASGVVRFSPALVTAALASAPRSFVLGSRHGQCDLDLASRQTFNTTNGCGTEVIDWRSGVRRTSTKADLAAITRLTDYLGSLQFWWPTVAASDCGATHELHELEAGWGNTVKHLQGMVQGERAARYAVEMATVVAGGAEELRRRPVMSDLIGTVQPLVNDKDGIEAALVFAAAGVPVCFVTMPTYGTTAPATKAGALVMGFAELLSAAVLVQLAHPGAPVLAFPLPVHADPRTAALVTAPLDHRGLFLPTALVHHFGLPAMSGYAGTDDDLPGTWLAAAETAHTVMLAGLVGSELMTTIGLTNRYQLFTPEHMLLDDDLYHRAASAFRDLELDDETLALDVIDAVGPGGHFLAQAHTRRHMKETVERSIGQQIGPDGVHYRDPVEVARERGVAILEGYRPEALDEDKQRELRRIVAAADAELRD